MPRSLKKALPHPDTKDQPSVANTEPHFVTIAISAVPADKIRDVVKVAVMPLASGGAEIEVDLEIRAHNRGGISRSTLDLVVAEGLQQLGVTHSFVEASETS
jgi:hypothetical protein